MTDIVIVDYGAGNLRSVQKAFEQLGYTASVTEDPAAVAQAPAVVFPGQGASPPAMEAMNKAGLTEAIHTSIAAGTPFFGVCLGLQLLMDVSEEGPVDCLGVLSGITKKLPVGLKVPHMGWNSVRLQAEHPVFQGIPQDSYFYFVHSYYAEPADDDVVLGTTDYGVPFCSVATQGNLIATQFHPEKSGPTGLKLYDNFMRYVVLQQPVPTAK
jgi:glutamine amidotransferase